MLFLFRSRAVADMLMLPGPARQLLAIIGKPPRPGQTDGIIPAQDAPQAVAALLEALARENRPAAAQEDAAEDQEPPVGLHQRAVPLVDMLRRSAARGCDVLWTLEA